MPEIKVRHNGELTVLDVKNGTSLLEALRFNGFDVYSPCGGNGTCGKCRIRIKSEDSVASCIYHVTHNIELALPDKREARILSEQHDFTVPAPFMPGMSATLSTQPKGIAIDLGTTSVVFYLVSLTSGTLVKTLSVLNPQAAYGADVMSRISYASENTDGLFKLQQLITGCINEQVERMAGSAGISTQDIVKITIAGNTTMLHLLLAVDPLPLARAPFTPGFTEQQILHGSELGLKCHPYAEIKLLPGLSAFVGADIVSGLASIRTKNHISSYLFMDIGTNGELALVSEDRVLCCSAAAGPAFEGAKISSGMGGVVGAISSYDENGYTVIGDASPAGICGSGLIDIVAMLLEQGTLESEGLLPEEYMVVPAEQAENNRPITINQQDIREVQLAKAAISAGIKMLIREAGQSVEDIDAVFLAGGFGNYINPDSALRIGLIPPEFRGKIIPLGNTSGTGALLSLKSTPFDFIVDDLLKRTTYLELSGNDEFTTEFALNMNF